jgi:hypothetical protein
MSALLSAVLESAPCQIRRPPPPGFFVSVAPKGLSGMCPLDARGKRVASDELIERREQAIGEGGIPPPRVFCAKSAEEYETKRVGIVGSAKECVIV